MFLLCEPSNLIGDLRKKTAEIIGKSATSIKLAKAVSIFTSYCSLQMKLSRIVQDGNMLDEGKSVQDVGLENDTIVGFVFKDGIFSSAVICLYLSCTLTADTDQWEKPEVFI